MFAQAEKTDKLSNVGETEKPDEKEKRKAELFEKERQERLSKLDEWKVMCCSIFVLFSRKGGVVERIKTDINRHPFDKIYICGSLLFHTLFLPLCMRFF